MRVLLDPSTWGSQPWGCRYMTDDRTCPECGSSATENATWGRHREYFDCGDCGHRWHEMIY